MFGLKSILDTGCSIECSIFCERCRSVIVRSAFIEVPKHRYTEKQSMISIARYANTLKLMVSEAVVTGICWVFCEFIRYSCVFFFRLSESVVSLCDFKKKYIRI